ELALVDWDDAQKTAFLRMQFFAQHKYYQEHFADAAFDIILLDGQPIGRLYVARREDHIHVIDISLLLEYRGVGIGTASLAHLISEASATEKRVRTNVERFNRAWSLYERLGFAPVADHGVYVLLERSPRPQPNTAS